LSGSSDDTTMLSLSTTHVRFPATTLQLDSKPKYFKVKLTNRSQEPFVIMSQGVPLPFGHSKMPMAVRSKRYEEFSVSFQPREKGFFQCVLVLTPVNRSDIAPLAIKLEGTAV
jgi:hypothetical protein